MINEHKLFFDRLNIKCNNLKGKIAHLTDLHLDDMEKISFKD